MARGAAAKDGRAARAKEEMPLPGEKVAVSSIGPQLGREKHESIGRGHSEIETHLLNILTDDKGRSEMGVERGW